MDFIKDNDPIALYAAVLSTAIFIFEIYKWIFSGPRLHLNLSNNMKFIGGGPLYPKEKTYIKVSVRNTGAMKTTITGVYGEFYKNFYELIRKKPSDSFFVTGDNGRYSVPYVLDVGSEFLSLADQNDEIVKLSNNGLLYLGIHHTFSRKLLKKRVLPIKSTKNDL